jgi:hypothetical protein
VRQTYGDTACVYTCREGAGHPIPSHHPFPTATAAETRQNSQISELTCHWPSQPIPSC